MKIKNEIINKKILITGSTGQIGKFLLKNLNSDNIYFSSRKNNPNSNHLYLNLESPNSFEYELIKDSYVLHSAGVSSPNLCSKFYEDSYKINVKGTIEFLEKCIDRFCNIIFFSSDMVYAKNRQEYADMKFEIEEYFKSTSLFKSIRLSYVLSNENKFLNYLKECSAKNIIADIYHPIYRKVIIIEDVLEAIKIILNNWNDIGRKNINVGGNKLVSRLDLTKLFLKSKKYDLSYKIKSNKTNPFKTPDIIDMDNSFLKDNFNWKLTDLSNYFKNDF